MSHALGLRREFERIDRSMSIVAETEQIADHQNSCLKSRAQISGIMAHAHQTTESST
jgi:hypothetical protein